MNFRLMQLLLIKTYSVSCVLLTHKIWGESPLNQRRYSNCYPENLKNPKTLTEAALCLLWSLCLNAPIQYAILLHDLFQFGQINQSSLVIGVSELFSLKPPESIGIWFPRNSSFFLGFCLNKALFVCFYLILRLFLPN